MTTKGFACKGFVWKCNIFLGIKFARRIDGEWGQTQVSNMVWVNENITHTQIKWKSLRVKKVQSPIFPHEYPQMRILKLEFKLGTRVLAIQSWIWKTKLKSLTWCWKTSRWHILHFEFYQVFLNIETLKHLMELSMFCQSINIIVNLKTTSIVFE